VSEATTTSGIMTTAELPQEATRRLQPKKQTLDDAYAAPANFLEIDVVNPITHGVGRTRFTDYEVRMRVSLINDHICCVPRH
jgi:sorting nexin-3/12